MTFTEGPIHERNDIVVQEPVAAVVDVPVVNGQVVVPTAPVASAQVRTDYASRFAPDAIIAGLIGLVILVTGLIAITRGGFDGEMSDPVVQVLGFSHTTILGLIEIAIGGALLISGATRSRSGEIFFGASASLGSSAQSRPSPSRSHWPSSRRWPGWRCSPASSSCLPR